MIEKKRANLQNAYAKADTLHNQGKTGILSVDAAWKAIQKMAWKQLTDTCERESLLEQYLPSTYGCDEVGERP